MARMKDLVLDIQEAMEAGELSFASIAEKFKVDVHTVELCWQELMQQYEHEAAYVADNDYVDDYEV